MKFVVKKVNKDMYMCTNRLDVHNIEFAKHFNSEKQAKTYAGSSHFKTGEYVLVSVNDDNENITDVDTIKEKVLDHNIREQIEKNRKMQEYIQKSIK